MNSFSRSLARAIVVALPLVVAGRWFWSNGVTGEGNMPPLMGMIGALLSFVVAIAVLLRVFLKFRPKNSEGIQTEREKKS